MRLTDKERHEKWKAARTPEERRAYSQANHQRNRDAEVLVSRRLNRTVFHRYGVLRNAAKKRHLQCTLSFDEYAGIVSAQCFYCGGALPEVGYGLDRVNNDAGYVPGNVRPCCHPCNQAKSSFTETQFKEWILRLYNTFVMERR